MDTPNSQQSKRDARIVERHLPDGYTASPEVVDYPEADDADEVSQKSGVSRRTAEQSSLRLQGGDIHRDIFRIKARAAAPRRSATFSANQSPHLQPANAISVHQQLEPNGFRRQYVQRQGMKRSLSTVAQPVTKNFVSFLALYGSFAGEDLEDSDDYDDDDEESHDAESAIEEDGRENGERRPLLRRSTTAKGSRRLRREGDAGTVKTFFTLLKAFVGTGIMFLPKAFRNGGILFSSITLLTVSIITTICFRLLLQCREKYGGGGYGELGESIFGKKTRSLILGSITLSQLGFVCAGIIFTAQNLLSFLNAVTFGHTTQPFGTNSLIAIQFVVLIPLALIRNISKLGPSALVADIFIMVGLVYIWQYDITSLVTRGMAPSVVLFNPSAFTLTIGSAIFTFEGIGLILPIASSMKEPEKFNKLLYLVMVIITIIFTSVGALCYATFGDETKIQIISNFPQDSKLVNAVQFLYSLAVLVGEPVQLFPAVRIIETRLFEGTPSGKKSSLIKWKKNLLRSSMMVMCGLIAIVGAQDLDKFVALIGAFACVPLVYIYPPLLHLKAVAKSTSARAFDIGLICIGVIAMVYSTAMTVLQWIRD